MLWAAMMPADSFGSMQCSIYRSWERFRIFLMAASLTEMPSMRLAMVLMTFLGMGIFMSSAILVSLSS